MPVGRKLLLALIVFLGVCWLVQYDQAIAELPRHEQATVPGANSSALSAFTLPKFLRVLAGPVVLLKELV